MNWHCTLARVAMVMVAASPLAAHAELYEFNTRLDAASEIPLPDDPNADASGLATLIYDDSTNTYDLSLSAFDLSGPVEAAHLHGLATESETSGVITSLTDSPFVVNNADATLLIGGDDIVAPAELAANNGHPAQSFLEALQSSLLYLNVHTDAFPDGEIRGQLRLVNTSPVPESSNWAMMLAGIGLVGYLTRRRVRGFNPHSGDARLSHRA